MKKVFLKRVHDIWSGLRRFYLLSLVARYVPSPIMMAPVTVRCRRRNDAEERIRSPKGPASAITISLPSCSLQPKSFPAPRIAGRRARAVGLRTAE